MSYQESNRTHIHRSIMIQVVRVLILLSIWSVVQFPINMYEENSVGMKELTLPAHNDQNKIVWITSKTVIMNNKILKKKSKIKMESN
jgi:hypothetical protein